MEVAAASLRPDAAPCGFLLRRTVLDFLSELYVSSSMSCRAAAAFNVGRSATLRVKVQLKDQDEVRQICPYNGSQGEQHSATNIEALVRLAIFQDTNLQSTDKTSSSFNPASWGEEAVGDKDQPGSIIDR